MALRSNNFDGGTNGTTITIENSSDGGQSTLNYVNIGTGAAVTYGNEHAHSGTLAAKIVPATGQTAYISYGGTSGTLASNDTAAEFWLYLTANLTEENPLLFASDNGGTRRLQLNFQTDGRVRLRTEGAAWLWTSSSTVPLNTWVRFRVFTRNQGAGASLTKIAFYNGATLIDQFSTSTSDRTGIIDALAVGKYYTGTLTQTFWVDDFAVETAATGYIGEVAAAVNGTVTTQAIIDATSSTGTITNWAISQQSGPSGAATQLSSGIWSVPVPVGSAAVWRVTITVDGNQYTNDFTVDPVDISTDTTAPVVLLYREAGVWV